MPTFTLSTYGGPYISQGGSGIIHVYVDSEYGFASNVNLTVSGLPSGVTGSFSPNPSPVGSGVLTLMASSSATVGAFEAKIAGTSGTLSTTANIFATITASPSVTSQ